MRACVKFVHMRAVSFQGPSEQMQRLSLLLFSICRLCRMRFLYLAHLHSRSSPYEQWKRALHWI